MRGHALSVGRAKLSAEPRAELALHANRLCYFVGAAGSRGQWRSHQSSRCCGLGDDRSDPAGKER
eukprot:2945321-Alexandrium_andersonii.AAC.1